MQWINVLRNNSFINPLQLVFYVKNWNRSTSATGSYGTQAGRLADNMLLHLRIFLNYILAEILEFIGFPKGTM